MTNRSRPLLTLLLLAIALCGSMYAQTHIPTLQQAVAAGQVNQPHIYGTGGSSGDSVMVEVSKGPKAASGPITVSVPPGSQLASSDAGAQSMVIVMVAGRVTGPRKYTPSFNIVVPASGTATYILNAFCAEFHKENPSESTSFTLLPPDPTLACIANQSRKAGASTQATQAAVWIYTDRLTFQEINDKFVVSLADWNEAREVDAACGISR